MWRAPRGALSPLIRLCFIYCPPEPFAFRAMLDCESDCLSRGIDRFRCRRIVLEDFAGIKVDTPDSSGTLRTPARIHCTRPWIDSRTPTMALRTRPPYFIFWALRIAFRSVLILLKIPFRHQFRALISKRSSSGENVPVSGSIALFSSAFWTTLSHLCSAINAHRPLIPACSANPVHRQVGSGKILLRRKRIFLVIPFIQ